MKKKLFDLHLFVYFFSPKVFSQNPSKVQAVIYLVRGALLFLKQTNFSSLFNLEKKKKLLLLK